MKSAVRLISVILAIVMLCPILVSCSSEKECNNITITNGAFSTAFGRTLISLSSITTEFVFEEDSNADICLVTTEAGTLIRIGGEQTGVDSSDNDLPNGIKVSGGDRFYWGESTDDKLPNENIYLRIYYLKDDEYVGYAVVRMRLSASKLLWREGEMIKSVIISANDKSYYDEKIDETIEKDKSK